MRFKNIVVCFFLISLIKWLQGSEFEDSEIALHHFMQGEFLMNQGQYSLAILEFQDAIDLDPNASTIHISIADAYLKLGKVKRSKSHLEIAIDLNPEEYEQVHPPTEGHLQKKPRLSRLGYHLIDSGRFRDRGLAWDCAGGGDCLYTYLESQCDALDHCLTDHTDSCYSPYDNCRARLNWTDRTLSKINYFCLSLFFPGHHRNGEGVTFSGSDPHGPDEDLLCE